MLTIHDKAWHGSLTKDDLDDYLVDKPAVNPAIDQPGGEKNLTPLAAACLRGHLNVVELLLATGADVNALSPKNRTALFYTTSRPKRHAIVCLLLAANAQVDIADEKGITPLMNAVVQSREVAVIHELVDHGADISRRNRNGQSAKSLAAMINTEQELKPRKVITSTSGAIIDLIVAIVLFIVAYINNGNNQGVMGRLVKKLWHISGVGDEDSELAAEINSAQHSQPTALVATPTTVPPPVAAPHSTQIEYARASKD